VQARLRLRDIDFIKQPRRLCPHFPR
jgi:hypothetical protein